ncbi:MAG: Gfo/Idh/MocA family protein [Verrucomicrobiales bacterium]
MNKLGRRAFLERSMLAVTAASFPANSFSSRAGAPPASPSERVGIALVGAGGRGRGHLPSLLALSDVDVTAVCDVDESAAGEAMKAVERKTGRKPQYYRDYRKLLEDKSVDAVSIATPNHWHTLQALWAIQAGKDAYVEKPISHNVFEGRKLIEAARKYNRVVTQGSQRRSWPSHIEAIEFLHSGRLGKLKRVHGICYKGRGSIGKKPDEPVPPGVDYDLWLGPAPVRPFNPNRFHYNWHWHWDYGNGDLGNTGVHDMDVIVWGIQKSELPNKILSFGGRFGYEDDGETPNTQIVAMDYGELDIIYEVRGLKTEPFHNSRMAAIFHCTDGYLVAANGPVAAFDAKGEKIKDFGAQAEDEPHFRNFVDAVKNRSPGSVRVSVLDAHLGSAFCHLPNISYRLGKLKPLSIKNPLGEFDGGNECYDRMCKHFEENGLDLQTTQVRIGRSLKFDSKTETFVGDAEADQLLRREYRKPFIVPEEV